MIFTWVSGNLYHIASQGNYSLWTISPITSLPVAHTIFDPHFSLVAANTFSSGSADISSILTYSGLYNVLYTVGFTSPYELFICQIGFLILALLTGVLTLIHTSLRDSIGSNSSLSSSRGLISELLALPTILPELRLSYHLGGLLGVSSCAWALHIVYVAIPASSGGECRNFLPDILTLNWANLSAKPEATTHIFGSPSSSAATLTFLGSFNAADALYLSDISHHHLALGVLLIWSAHLYSSLNRSIGSKLRSLAYSIGSYSFLLSPFVIGSLELELSLALAAVGQTTVLVAQHIYSLPAYVFLSSDFVTCTALYAHHFWIGGIFLMGSFVHGAVFLIKDFVVSRDSSDTLTRLLSSRYTLTSHLSWVTLWLGFHTLLVYSHNDSVTALGASDLQILITPLFAQIIQEASGNPSYGFSLFSPGASVSQAFLTLSDADFLVHHALSLGIHTTVLVLLKGALDSRGTNLFADKVGQGYGFPCDGPGRSGTCDISTWDAFYLSFFWLLNTISWALFYFHYRHLAIWQQLSSSFSENGSTLMGWFRDYLWFNSAPLIRGYSIAATNDISPWSWLFLAAHLCWATGFMFLISWRGYWQELIDVIIFMHLRTPIVGDIWYSSWVTPVALSIVQARFIDLVHFAVGLILTYAAFVIGATS